MFSREKIQGSSKSYRRMTVIKLHATIQAQILVLSESQAFLYLSEFKEKYA